MQKRMAFNTESHGIDIKQVRLNGLRRHNRNTEKLIETLNNENTTLK
jgi:hypothetical protein